jgi:RHS repeat-associated protein
VLGNGADPQYSTTYDAEGNLLQVGGGVHNLINGARQRVNVSGREVYDDAGHVLGEYEINTNYPNPVIGLVETIWLGDLPVATIMADESWDANGDPTGLQYIISYVHADHLNTPRRITQPSNNALMWRWDSDPFGIGYPNEHPSGGSLYEGYFLRFPGQEYDGATGYYYNGYRYYDPASGRYAQSDPIGLRGGVNTYAYVGGNPLSNIDPLGMCDDNPASDASGLLASEKNLVNWITSNPGQALAAAATMVTLPVGGEGGLAVEAVEGAAAGGARFIANTAGDVLDAEAPLYRVFGGEATGSGQYWSTVDPATVADYRTTAGLFPGNSGRFVAEGQLTDTSEVTFGVAAPGPGGVGGGLSEVKVPNAGKQICFRCVSGANPPF